MELKEFIKSTIAAIADATTELQTEYEEKEVLVNPPSAQSGSDVYQPGSSNYTFRRVQNVEFDVAITASSETSGGGKAGIKVFSAEIGANGEVSSAAETANRVKFSVPMALKPSSHERQNKTKKEEEEEASRQAIAASRQSRGSWSA